MLKFDHLPAAGPLPWGGILLVYFSTHGHTEAVAERLADALRRDGLDVDVRDVAHAGDVDPERHDAVVIAASLHREPHRSEIVDWVRAHRMALADRPTALLSVSLSARDGGTIEDPALTRRAVDELLFATGWRPARSVTISDDASVDRFADDIAVIAATPLSA